MKKKQREWTDWDDMCKYPIKPDKKTPYIGVGNEQIETAPELPNKVPCFKCGKPCQIGYSKPGGTLQFISCCGKTWLVGINNKLVEHIKPKISGEL